MNETFKYLYHVESWTTKFKYTIGECIVNNLITISGDRENMWNVWYDKNHAEYQKAITLYRLSDFLTNRIYKKQINEYFYDMHLSLRIKK